MVHLERLSARFRRGSSQGAVRGAAAVVMVGCVAGCCLSHSSWYLRGVTIPTMAKHVSCDLCANEVDVHSSYIVRIDAFADPAVPPLSTDEIESTDFDQKLDDLLDQMKNMTASELQDGV